MPEIASGIWASYLKRWGDAFAAAILLILLSPVLIVAALIVRLTSPGPILFRQLRAGRNGNDFVILKFRTMRGDRKPDPSELVPLGHAEITRGGWWLRRTKIDELPQLINVLRGDMALVGPRPTLPDQAKAYDQFRRQRLLVRPGITGLAQIHGNTAISWDERILFDIAYVRSCGWLLDLRIMAKTLGVIITGEPESPPRFRDTRFARCVNIPDNYFQPQPTEIP